MRVGHTAQDSQADPAVHQTRGDYVSIRVKGQLDCLLWEFQSRHNLFIAIIGTHSPYLVWFISPFSLNTAGTS